jgi:hypothetical protein
VVLAIRIGLALTLLGVIAAAVLLPKLAEKAPITLRGTTAQDHPIAVVLDEDRSVRSVDVKLSAPCQDGTSVSLDWRAGAALFGPDGVAVERGRENWTDGTAVRTTARAEVAEDGRSGRVGYSAHLSRPDGENVICRSGPVAFTAR